VHRVNHFEQKAPPKCSLVKFFLKLFSCTSVFLSSFNIAVSFPILLLTYALESGRAALRFVCPFQYLMTTPSILTTVRKT